MASRQTDHSRTARACWPAAPTSSDRLVLIPKLIVRVTPVKLIPCSGPSPLIDVNMSDRCPSFLLDKITDGDHALMWRSRSGCGEADRGVFWPARMFVADLNGQSLGALTERRIGCLPSFYYW